MLKLQKKSALEERKGKSVEVVILKAEGRIDSNSAPKLEEELKFLEGNEHLVLDFSELEYTSSAGIRVLLSAYKTLREEGTMKLTGVNDEVYEVLRTTGIAEKLIIERSTAAGGENCSDRAENENENAG